MFAFTLASLCTLSCIISTGQLMSYYEPLIIVLTKALIVLTTSKNGYILQDGGIIISWLSLQFMIMQLVRSSMY